MICAGTRVCVSRRAARSAFQQGQVHVHKARSSATPTLMCHAADADSAPAEAASPSSDAQAKLEISDIVTGKEYKGTVKAVAAYGCFVDIGASTDGLVHVSQLSNSYVKDINSFVSVGQEVVVRVLGVEGDKKLSLTMKNKDEEGTGDGDGQVRRAPRMRRDRAEHGLSVGDKVKGEVLRIAGFGAFLRLPDGFEVLLPTSEMSAAEDLDPNPHTLVTVGNVMDVTVLKVDGGKVGVTAITDEDRAAMAEASKGATSAGASAAVGGSMLGDLAALGLEDMFGTDSAGPK